MGLWHVFKDEQPKDKQEVFINTTVKTDTYGVALRCTCEYSKRKKCWKLLDETFMYAADEHGYLPCKEADDWCPKEEYDAAIKEIKKQKQEVKKLKKQYQKK